MDELQSTIEEAFERRAGITPRNVEARLKELFPFQPVLEPAVDPSLLGGLRIRVGDTVYDGSLRARLKQLRHRVRERSLHEIQSGRDRFSHSERD